MELGLRGKVVIVTGGIELDPICRTMGRWI